MEDKKKEIVNYFLDKRVLLNPNLVDKLEGYGDLDNFCNSLVEKGHKISEKGIIDFLDGERDDSSAAPVDEGVASEIKKKDMSEIKLVSSYVDEPRKRTVQDFVSYFNKRYKFIESLLQQRQELQNLISINKVVNKKDRGTVSIIGLINKIQTTKNGNIMFTVEDVTGNIRVLVNKNKSDIFNIAKDMVLDEVIGVNGVNGDNVVFANNIIFPDVPLSKELKKSPEEEYIIFLSDLHVGSANFLPDKFNKFLEWINGGVGNDVQKRISSKIKYVFVLGDLVAGVGIYPDQESELTIQDVREQYSSVAEFLKKIPNHIKIVICSGNHDAIRLAEPQPPFYHEFAKEIWEMNNVFLVSNPSMVNICSKDNFSGFDVLLYHGYSFIYYSNNVESIRSQKGIERADLIMKFLLQRRHLAPSHTSTTYIPDSKKDPLLIEKIPDFFAAGHIHKTSVSNYRNVTLICSSCWESRTSFEEKLGLHPEPARVPIVNLQTRQVKILKF